MKKLSIHNLLVLIITVGMFSCTTKSGFINEPETPDLPDGQETLIQDTILLKIGTSLDVEEENYSSRSENSRDLIGVEITRKTSGSETNVGVPSSVIYASGVFDDIDNIIFKFVKGGTYSIKMCYYPNAKDIVYNYPDGTFGAPFSEIFGLQSYRLNEPVYYTGVNGGWDGNEGPRLLYLLEDTYQPTNDRHVQASVRGTTKRYMGKTNYFTVTEGTRITMQLELCMMSLTLQPDNFTEGELTLCFRNYQYMEGDNGYWTVRPGDDMTLNLQVPYDPGEESLELFYTNADGEKFLLATKQLYRKHRTNFIFKFALVDREDGSIGIQMPDEDYENKDTSFDF